MQHLLRSIFFLIMVMIGRFCRLAQGFTPQQRLLKRNNTPFQMVLADPVSTLLKSSEDAVLDPLVVCGPSGVGKGTIIAKFMEELGGNELFGFTVSHTTRAPREGESDGIHYHFVDHEYMKKEIAGGAFLEYAEVHGNYYGTSWSSLRDVQTGGKRCLLDIDVQGVQNIKTMESDGLKPKYIFIAPPSLRELEERLVGRGTETPESLARRSANARKELEYGMDADNNNFDALVVNQNLDVACREFARVVRDLYDL